jgi:hypothetical protein
MSFEQLVISSLEEWKPICKSLNIHQGVIGNRVQEFKNWVSILPLVSLYKFEEKDFTLSYDSSFVIAKIAIAGLVIIVDDVVDNSSPAIIELFDTNLINLGNQVTIYGNHRLHDEGIRIICNIISAAKKILPTKSELDFDRILTSFFASVSQENKQIVEILLGNRTTFEERLIYSGTQGATASMMIDYYRLKTQNLEQFITLGNSIDSLLALKNSITTINSEIQHGEITSPLFVLACELENVSPIDKTGDMEWFRIVSSNPDFSKRIKVAKSTNYMAILSQLQILMLDSSRFTEGFGLIYN